MADALLFANRFMDRNGHVGGRDRMIMLLADGQNDRGNVGRALATLQPSGIIFRHDTVGFGIMPTSPAAEFRQQRRLAEPGSAWGMIMPADARPGPVVGTNRRGVTPARGEGRP